MEPTYEFIRGSGWVVSTAPFLDFEVNGKRWRIIARKPNIGERCCWSSTQNQHYATNGKPNLQNWRWYFGDYPDTQHKFESTDEEFIAERFKDEGVLFVTLIPLDGE